MTIKNTSTGSKIHGKRNKKTFEYLKEEQK